VWDVLRPHVSNLIEFAEQHEIADPTLRLMSELGGLLWAKALYSEAERWERRALELAENVHGLESPEVATRLSNLAQTLQATDRLSEAEPLMRRALAIFRASLGDEHPTTQTAATNYESLRAACEAQGLSLEP